MEYDSCNTITSPYLKEQRSDDSCATNPTAYLKEQRIDDSCATIPIAYLKEQRSDASCVTIPAAHLKVQRSDDSCATIPAALLFPLLTWRNSGVMTAVLQFSDSVMTTRPSSVLALLGPRHSKKTCSKTYKVLSGHHHAVICKTFTVIFISLILCSVAPARNCDFLAAQKS